MFCRSCNMSFKAQCISKINILRHITNQTTGVERDPAPVFFNANVQQLLKKLTRVDLRTVFRTKRYGVALKTPEYKFLTAEELNMVMKEAQEKAEQKLQMPPVVKAHVDEPEVLSYDYELQKHSETKFVFTDISFGISDVERTIVVRDLNGVLRKATPDERLRMNETYFPKPGRKIRMPHMFEKEYLKRLLDQGKYEFVLDRACLQFEPDQPIYQDITATTYEAVDTARHYSSLRSTRHFGPFAFHLAWNRCIDNFLLDLIQTDRLDETVALIQLYHIVNPEAESASAKYKPGLEHKFIQAYVESDSKKRSVLELALQANVELHKQRAETEAGIRRAHGHA
ncbi:28S ribosomal protein S22, mitochondrial [Zootermopsis nevadensis]|uniref:28S ribosomal protein S22, mitochondrial n=2 Tax=Zootermopsis nevadensis TaxID=136037 RepID=A0A067QRU5_ZOONE|nr:28S ribosomal protein S22, mitochondrial [Zootermopsis nevadensis]